MVPLVILGVEVKTAQLTYAVLGSLFMPLLAVTLLIMNNRTRWVGRAFRSGWITNLMLMATLAFFAYVAGDTAVRKYRELTSATPSTPPQERTAS